MRLKQVGKAMDFKDAEDFANFFENEAEAAEYLYRAAAETVELFFKHKAKSVSITQDHWYVEFEDKEHTVTIAITVLRGEMPLGIARVWTDSGNITINLDDRSADN